MRLIVTARSEQVLPLPGAVLNLLVPTAHMGTLRPVACRVRTSVCPVSKFCQALASLSWRLCGCKLPPLEHNLMSGVGACAECQCPSGPPYLCPEDAGPHPQSLQAPYPSMSWEGPLHPVSWAGPRPPHRQPRVPVSAPEEG